MSGHSCDNKILLLLFGVSSINHIYILKSYPKTYRYLQSSNYCFKHARILKTLKTLQNVPKILQTR